MAERITAEATIVAARRGRGGGQADDGEAYWWQDLGSAALGKTTWDLALDVSVPGGSPYRVEIRTKQPNRLFGIRGFLDGSASLAPGLVLPVLVDPGRPEQVEVDWKAFAAQPEARARMRGADDAKRSAQANAIFAAKIREDPAGFEQRRRIVLDGAEGIVGEVRAGRMPLATLEHFLATHLAPGIITHDEADAFRQAAGAEPSA